MFVQLGEPPDPPLGFADFEDEDNQTTVVGLDCFFQVCSDVVNGFVDPVVIYNAYQLQPSTFFVLVQGGDGYARAIDEGFAPEPIEYEFRDRFEATLVIEPFDDTPLLGQDVDMELDVPFAYHAWELGQFAHVNFVVPEGAEVLSVNIEGQGFVYLRPGEHFDEPDGFGRASEYEYGASPKEPRFVEAIPGIWHVVLNGRDGGGISGKLTVTADEDVVPPDLLRNGVPVRGLSGGADETIGFFADIPVSAECIVITLEGGAGDADLWAHHVTPTEFPESARVSQTIGNDERIAITAPAGYITGDRLFVEVVASPISNGFDDVTLTAMWE